MFTTAGKVSRVAVGSEEQRDKGTSAVAAIEFETPLNKSLLDSMEGMDLGGRPAGLKFIDWDVKHFKPFGKKQRRGGGGGQSSSQGESRDRPSPRLSRGRHGMGGGGSRLEPVPVSASQGRRRKKEEEERKKEEEERAAGAARRTRRTTHLVGRRRERPLRRGRR